MQPGGTMIVLFGEENTLLGQGIQLNSDDIFS